jgi:hypothetical protein
MTSQRATDAWVSGSLENNDDLRATLETCARVCGKVARGALGFSRGLELAGEHATVSRLAELRLLAVGYELDLGAVCKK